LCNWGFASRIEARHNFNRSGPATSRFLLYNRKNKTFFYIATEAYRGHQPVAGSFSMPTAAAIVLVNAVLAVGVDCSFYRLRGLYAKADPAGAACASGRKRSFRDAAGSGCRRRIRQLAALARYTAG
jgi:hypothetical protein